MSKEMIELGDGTEIPVKDRAINHINKAFDGHKTYLDRIYKEIADDLDGMYIDTSCRIYGDIHSLYSSAVLFSEEMRKNLIAIFTDNEGGK